MRSVENVLKAGNAAGAGGQSNIIPAGYGETSLRDAIGILMHCVRASEEGLQVALQSGAIEAIIDVIQVPCTQMGTRNISHVLHSFHLHQAGPRIFGRHFR